MNEHQAEDVGDEVATGELDRTRSKLRGLLDIEKKYRFSSEFPRSRTLRMLTDPRHRTLLLALGSGCIMLLTRRFPAGRIASLVGAYRGAKRMFDASRH